MANGDSSLLGRLAHLISRHRRKVIFAWVALTLFGAFSASQVSKRWYQSFSIPGKSAYEANQRTLKTFGTGIRPPDVVVFHTTGDATKNAAIADAMRRASAAVPGSRSSSYFSTHDRMYVSKDRHTTFEEVYPPGPSTFSTKSGAYAVRAAAARGLPSGVQVEVTGHDPLEEASSHGGGGGNVLVEAVIGGLGAIVILLFVFGTLPAVLMPLAVAVGAILNTFTLVWALTYITNVSIIVQYLIALVGLGVAIDYALLMIFRFRDELREGEDVETALVETMTHAGRSVIVSGSTVAVGLLSMVILPLPFIRSIGIGGMLIPAVSVLDENDEGLHHTGRDARLGQRRPARDRIAAAREVLHLCLARIQLQAGVDERAGDDREHDHRAREQDPVHESDLRGDRTSRIEGPRTHRARD